MVNSDPKLASIPAHVRMSKLPSSYQFPAAINTNDNLTLRIFLRLKINTLVLMKQPSSTTQYLVILRFVLP